MVAFSVRWNTEIFTPDNDALGTVMRYALNVFRHSLSDDNDIGRVRWRKQRHWNQSAIIRRWSLGITK